MSHGSFFWYDLVSRDTAATRAFLTRMFDWVASEAQMPDGTSYTSFSTSGNVVCGLIPLDAKRDFDERRAHWITYIRVDRLFSAMARVERQGGEILTEPLPVPDLGSYQVVRDPDGALLALVEARYEVLNPGFAWNTVIWNELTCRDVGPAQEFYRAVTGWVHSPNAGGPDALDYGFFTTVGANVAGLLEMAGPDYGDLRPAWQAYIAVEDVDAMAAKVTECGGHVAAEPFDVPGVGRIAIVIEPGGCQLSLLCPPT